MITQQPSILSNTQQSMPTKQIAPHPKYKNIIFDVGNVLAYFNPREFWAEIFGDESKIEERYLSIHKTPEWQERDRGYFEGHEEIADALAHSFEKNLVVQFSRKIAEKLLPIEQGFAMFKAAKRKGYKIYILSNMDRRGHKILQGFPDFLEHFDGAIFSYEIKQVKPERAIYKTLLEKYNLKPEECLFIDDVDLNIAAGKDLGIDGIVCSNHDETWKTLRSMGILD